jgi:single-stranded DNA-binding protein
MIEGIQAEFTGTVGADVVARVTKTGKPWLTFNVMVGAGHAVQWVRVALFGDSVAVAAKSVVKGARVHIQGRLQLATWTDGNGKDRSSLQVTTWHIGASEPDDQAQQMDQAQAENQIRAGQLGEGYERERLAAAEARFNEERDASISAVQRTMGLTQAIGGAGGTTTSTTTSRQSPVNTAIGMGMMGLQAWGSYNNSNNSMTDPNFWSRNQTVTRA